MEVNYITGNKLNENEISGTVVDKARCRTGSIIDRLVIPES